MQNQNKRRTQILSDVRNLGSFLTGVQPEVPALLVIRVLTDAESESAGGNSEAGVRHWIVGLMLLVLQYQDPPHETQELKLVKDFHLPTPIAERKAVLDLDHINWLFPRASKGAAGSVWERKKNHIG